jgi:hypothetical protein
MKASEVASLKKGTAVTHKKQTYYVVGTEKDPVEGKPLIKLTDVAGGRTKLKATPATVKLVAA